MAHEKMADDAKGLILLQRSLRRRCDEAADHVVALDHELKLVCDKLKDRFSADEIADAAKEIAAEEKKDPKEPVAR